MDSDCSPLFDADASFLLMKNYTPNSLLSRNCFILLITLLLSTNKSLNSWTLDEAEMFPWLAHFWAYLQGLGSCHRESIVSGTDPSSWVDWWLTSNDFTDTDCACMPLIWVYGYNKLRCTRDLIFINLDILELLWHFGTPSIWYVINITWIRNIEFKDSVITSKICDNMRTTPKNAVNHE